MGKQANDAWSLVVCSKLMGSLATASKQAMVHGTWWWVQHLFKMVGGKKGMDSVVNCDINYRKSVDCEEIAL